MIRRAAIDRESKIGAELPGEPQAHDSARGSFISEGSLRFRPITTADLDYIMAIERNSYRFPWSANFFRQELQVACARSVLVESDDTIFGYVLFWLLPGAIEVHNIAVHSDYRRRGVARMLLDRVVNEARRQSIPQVILEVRKSNIPAQQLYQKIGFAVTGIRKGYYSDNGEDALAMTLELTNQS